MNNAHNYFKYVSTTLVLICVNSKLLPDYKYIEQSSGFMKLTTQLCRVPEFGIDGCKPPSPNTLSKIRA